jgi:hypothetical protein
MAACMHQHRTRWLGLVTITSGEDSNLSRMALFSKFECPRIIALRMQGRQVQKKTNDIDIENLRKSEEFSPQGNVSTSRALPALP